MLSIFLAILFNLLPSLILNPILDKVFDFKCKIYNFLLSWLTGQFLITFSIYITACALSACTDQLLYKSLVINYSVLILLSCLVIKKHYLKNQYNLNLVNIIKYAVFSITTSVISYALIGRHITQNGASIYRSVIYWDITCLIPNIQNFVYGDNFPPTDPFFANGFFTYHFFPALLMSVYSVLGFHLAQTINYVSVLWFTILLLSIFAVAKEIFGSNRTGLLAVSLTLTSSSMRYIDFFWDEKQSILNQIKDALSNVVHPYLYAFNNPSLFGYNGSMHNIFYYVAERHIILAVIFNIITLPIILRVPELPSRLLIIVGALMATFFQWNVASVIYILASLSFLSLLSAVRRKYIIMLIGFISVFLPYALFFRSITQDNSYLDITRLVPKINFEFSTFPPVYDSSFLNFIIYWCYAYGTKLLLLIIGLAYLKKINNHSILVFSSFLLPSFFIINCIQVFPLTIFDNHKFLLPLNVVINIICAFALIKLFELRIPLKIIIGSVMLFTTMYGGVIEHTTYLKLPTSTPYIEIQQKTLDEIRSRTPANSVFLSSNPALLNVAGRRLFVNYYNKLNGNQFTSDYMRDRDSRFKIAQDIYGSHDVNALCAALKGININYIEFDEELTNYPLYNAIKHLPSFEINYNSSTFVYVEIPSNFCI